MADAARSDLTQSVNYAMRHRSGQITFQNCQTCHAAALSRAASTPTVPTLWQGGALHASVPTQPGACVDCHAGSEPAANAPTPVGFVEPLAMALYADYLIPFEVASMLLLVAMVGAIILARKEA